MLSNCFRVLPPRESVVSDKLKFRNFINGTSSDAEDRRVLDVVDVTTVRSSRRRRGGVGSGCRVRVVA
jgi:hypothetical protein